MELSARNLLSEGILLAGASAYVYLVTFVYEYGYCSHFSIPRTLISPSLATVLIAAAAIGGVFVSSLKLLGLSAPLLRATVDPKQAPYRLFFGMNTLFAISGILLATIYGLSVRGALIFVGAVSVFELVYFAPVFLFNRKKPLRERFETYTKSKPDQLDLPILFTEWYGKSWLLPILILFALLLFAYLVGHGEATGKERFLTLKSSPDVVVLRNYGDLLIAARFDRARKVVSEELVLIRLGNDQKAEFFNEVIGPLTFAKK